MSVLVHIQWKMVMGIILTFTYPALCFLDLSEMPSLDMSLLKTTIPISMLTCGKETVTVLDKANRRQKMYI